MAFETVHGRCYCGSQHWQAPQPVSVVYCHCGDCKRWTGAPLPAFAAFMEADVDLPAGAVRRAFGDVTRWHCPDCGSPVAARFEYLPGQLFVPLGVIEEMDGLAPSLHCHSHKQAPWLHLDDGLPRSEGSGRDELNRRAGVDEG